ncbi:hypothetical protein [Fodinibius sediminis]|uniref:Uncharacterized protein n=1 Tax=Fodinibius sediminis TaxID=1214077 RepID=A0A521BFS6_9BACT|nr:hypothetical protein [Fodinibius sediminis]SMO45919.1 hypothetical protein SAMN06265218_10375 [Fodinibius sediminis]
MRFRKYRCPSSGLVKWTWFNRACMLLLAGIMITGCKDSVTDGNGADKDTQTFDLVLVAGGSKVGTVSTARITPDDDAYIDEGFFVTVKVTDERFNAPFDIYINNNNGYCGTFDVRPDEKAEMPCDYDDFLSNPTELTVTDENGDGESARPAS